MVHRRLASTFRFLCRSTAVLVVTGTLMSAAISPTPHWGWEQAGDLVPVDIAQGADDDATPPNENPARVVDVTTRGVVGDGVTSNTAAIQATIDGMRPKGGTLRFPAGRYVTGTIQLHDNTTLWLERGAVVLGSLDPAQYRVATPCGIRDCLLHGTALLVADRARNVAIIGKGTVDGRGAQLMAHLGRAPRPFLCRWVGCEHVTVTGVTFADPAFWLQHFHRCRHVRLDRVTVQCVDTENGNTDGIDIDSCQDVRITRCDISSGDDAICFKTTGPVPCKNILVENCRLTTRCNGVKFGTESVGAFEHIKVRRCSMTNVGMAGIAIFSVDGANVRDLTITDVQMRTVRTPIAIRLGARLATFHPGEHARPVGSIDGVTIRGVRATGATETGVLISGLPHAPVGRVTLEDVRIGAAGGIAENDIRTTVRELPKDYPQDDMFGRNLPAYGLYLRHIRGLTLLGHVTTDIAQPDARPDRLRIDVQ